MKQIMTKQKIWQAWFHAISCC